MEINEKVNDIKSGLSLYDLFGYLMPGFFCFSLFLFEYDSVKILRYFDKYKTIDGIDCTNLIFKSKLLLDVIFYKQDFSSSFILFIIFIFLCYLQGHIVSNFSSFLFKHTFCKIFRNPSENLIDPHPVRKYAEQAENKKGAEKYYYKILSWFHKKYTKINIFLGNRLVIAYRKPFERKFRELFIAKVNEVFKYDVEKKDYYWLISSHISVKYPFCIKLIKHYVNLYGFARNISGTFIFYIIFRLILSFLFDSMIDKFVIYILSSYLLIAIIMFWSFLKLYKRQAVEMYYMFYSLTLKNI